MALIALTIAVVLPVGGAIYQALCARNEAVRFPPSGRLIRIADGSVTRRLHLVCLGEGEPTVIFEPGAFNTSLSFEAARLEVSRHTRVCSYDRVGMGWSDPGPETIPAGLLAGDLERLTAQAHLQPPFLLVPSSMGGLTVELFARRHPDQVAGLVFSDAANSAMLGPIAGRFSSMQLLSVCLVKPAARFGLLRLLDPFGLRKEGSEAAARSISRLYRVEPAQTICGVVRGLGTTMQEFAAAVPLAPDIPLLVLIHETSGGFLPSRLANYRFLADRIGAFDREWLRLQQEFARQSRRGSWRVVPGSDHLIAAGQPHAVASSILEMLEDIRARR